MSDGSHDLVTLANGLHAAQQLINWLIGVFLFIGACVLFVTVNEMVQNHRAMTYRRGKRRHHQNYPRR